MAESAAENARENLFAELEASTNPTRILKQIEDVEISRAAEQTKGLR